MPEAVSQSRRVDTVIDPIEASFRALGRSVSAGVVAGLLVGGLGDGHRPSHHVDEVGRQGCSHRRSRSSKDLWLELDVQPSWTVRGQAAGPHALMLREDHFDDKVPRGARIDTGPRGCRGSSRRRHQ